MSSLSQTFCSAEAGNIGNNRKKILVQAIGTIILSTATLSSFAQTELPTSSVGGEEQDSYKVDTTSSVKYTQPLVDTPSTINIIPESVLRDQGVTGLNDALRNVAGVSTFGGGEGGGGTVTTNDKVTIRGFDANESVYIDGIRDVAGYSRDMFNYEQIEVTKGAAGSIAGRSSAGGSVNLSSKHARLENFGSVTASYDEAETKRITADYNAQLSDTVAGRVNLLHSDGGDRFDNGVEDYETDAFAGSLLFQISDRTTVTLDALVMNQDNTPMLGLPYITEAAAGPDGINLPEGGIPEGLWDNYYGVRGRDFEKVDTRMLTFIANHQVNDTLSLRNQTRWGSNDRSSVLGRPGLTSSGPGASYAAGEVQVSSIQALEEDNEIFITQFDALLNFGDESFSQDIVFGVEYSEEYQDRPVLTNNYTYFDENGVQVDTPVVDLFNPSRGITYTGGMVAGADENSAYAKNVALYFIDTLSFGPKWQATLSARYDDYRLTGDQFIGGGRGNPGTYTKGLKLNSDFLSWGAALSYKPVENGNFYLSFSDANEPPGANLAFSGGDTDRLDPQDADSYELGTKWELFNNNLLVSAAYFNTERSVLDTADDGSPFIGGKQESKGFELSAVGSLTDNLSLTATFTSLDTEITEDTNVDTEGNGLTAAPDETASLWLTYRSNDGRLTLGGGANYNSGEAYWRQNRAYFETDSVVIASAMAAYDVTDALNLQLNIDNLFDEDYATDFSARGHFLPNDPRMVKLTLRYNFFQ